MIDQGAARRLAAIRQLALRLKSQSREFSDGEALADMTLELLDTVDARDAALADLHRQLTASQAECALRLDHDTSVKLRTIAAHVVGLDAENAALRRTCELLSDDDDIAALKAGLADVRLGRVVPLPAASAQEAPREEGRISGFLGHAGSRPAGLSEGVGRAGAATAPPSAERMLRERAAEAEQRAEALAAQVRTLTQQLSEAREALAALRTQIQQLPRYAAWAGNNSLSIARDVNGAWVKASDLAALGTPHE